MADAEKNVECAEHGKSSGTYVCRHLPNGIKLGFNYAYDPERPDDLYSDAWCDACETVRSAEGEWNEKAKAFADIKLLCTACYEETRANNWLQQEEAFHELICSGFRYLEAKQSLFMEEFRINEHERWDWYQETGKLIFSHHGIPQVEADIDFSGSISSISNTWLWAWANQSLLEPLKSSSRQVRELGERHGYLMLAAAHWPGTVEDGWEMTAVMAKTINAIGTYRTPNDNGFTYMTIRQAQWL